MHTIILPLFNSEGTEIDRLKIDGSVFGKTLSEGALYQAIMAHMANRRKGLAATKTRGEVSGGGKKPWKQKGTGRARVGSIRSPLWRHGGVVFGPHPRDFSVTLPQSIRDLAFRSALQAKIKEGSLLVLESFSLANAQTKAAAAIFKNLKVASRFTKTKSILFLVEKIDENMKRAVRNISFLHCNLVRNTNAYEVLASRKVIVTKDSLDELIKRLKK